MKKMMVLTLLFLLTTLPVFGQSSHSHHSTRNTSACCAKSPSDVHVHGYTKKDGTVVRPYYRTAPNNTLKDNFSTKPNIDPYTGKVGTKKAPR